MDICSTSSKALEDWGTGVCCRYDLSGRKIGFWVAALEEVDYLAWEEL